MKLVRLGTRSVPSWSTKPILLLYEIDAENAEAKEWIEGYELKRNYNLILAIDNEGRMYGPDRAVDPDRDELVRPALDALDRGGEILLLLAEITATLEDVEWKAEKVKPRPVYEYTYEVIVKEPDGGVHVERRTERREERCGRVPRKVRQYYREEWTGPFQYVSETERFLYEDVLEWQEACGREVETNKYADPEKYQSLMESLEEAREGLKNLLFFLAREGFFRSV